MFKSKVILALLSIFFASCSSLSGLSTLDSPRQALQVINESNLNCSEPDSTSESIDGTLLVPRSQTLLCGSDENIFAVIILQSSEAFESAFANTCNILIEQADPADLYWDFKFAYGKNWISYPIYLEWSLFEGPEDVAESLGGQTISLLDFCSSLTETTNVAQLTQDTKKFCIAVEGLKVEYEKALSEYYKYLEIGNRSEELEEIIYTQKQYIMDSFNPKKVKESDLSTDVSKKEYSKIFSDALENIETTFYWAEDPEESKSDIDWVFTTGVYGPLASAFSCNPDEDNNSLKKVISNLQY